MKKALIILLLFLLVSFLFIYMLTPRTTRSPKQKIHLANFGQKTNVVYNTDLVDIYLSEEILLSKLKEECGDEYVYDTNVFVNYCFYHYFCEYLLSNKGRKIVLSSSIEDSIRDLAVKNHPNLLTEMDSSWISRGFTTLIYHILRESFMNSEIIIYDKKNNTFVTNIFEQYVYDGLGGKEVAYFLPNDSLFFSFSIAIGL